MLITDWEGWEYIHKTVRISAVWLYNYYNNEKDQPQQHNGFDCGVFASQVWTNVLINSTNTYK